MSLQTHKTSNFDQLTHAEIFTYNKLCQMEKKKNLNAASDKLAINKKYTLVNLHHFLYNVTLKKGH